MTDPIVLKLLQVIQALRDLTTDCGCDRLRNIREQADEALEKYGPVQFSGVRQGPCSDPMERTFIHLE